MNGGGADAPPSNGGEFLLQLLRRQQPNLHHPTPSPPQTFPHDPAVAAVGPSVPPFVPPHAALQSNFPWNHSSSPPPFGPPHTYFQQNPNMNPNLNPGFPSPSGGFGFPPHQFDLQLNRNSLVDDARKLGLFGDNSKPGLAHQQEPNLIFGSLNRDVLRNDAGNISYGALGQRIALRSSNHGDNLGIDTRLNALPINPIGINQKQHENSNNKGVLAQNGNNRAVAPPPGFSTMINSVGVRDSRQGKGTFDHNVDKNKGNSALMHKNNRLNQLDSTGPSVPKSINSVSGLDLEESMRELRIEDGDNGHESRDNGQDKMNGDREKNDLDHLEDQLVGSLGLEDESGEKNDGKKNHRDKEYRSDKRGQWIMGQRMRIQKSYTTCRNDINRFKASFLALFESLIPADEEKVKQKQLLTVLEKLVRKEWPDAKLFLYGSCGNSFGFAKSDIDVCLAMELGNSDKSEVLLKLADIFLAEKLENVQALTRARVPIVKLMDPVTGISCDICINNLLAVVNTKLLRDYAQIDERLRQLVFIVKHWAKSRGVNETYQGTLSSYAYVLMCIHFLQQQRPPILPCLQRMEITCYTTVDNVECAYFDQVDKLRDFGSRNGESIAQLVWAFFHYWAYCHDYANDVISVRTGNTISKRAKDWTRRVGNDRHLICIEDPFEVSHDLGRVVDKYSIRVLREEFERAAHIMQYDPNPCVTLFEPYIPD